MGFLNPILLWGSLGIIVPILIHLLNRYRHKEVDWGAMDLLRRALVVRSRQIRVEDILILLLRCLAVLLIALAMSRPTLTAAGAKWFGRQAQVGAVIALDSSFSMAHRPGINTRFDRAVERVREILKTFDTGSPVSFVLLGNRPRILQRNVGYDPAKIEKILHDLTPLPERVNLELCTEELGPLVNEIKAPVRECYLITDAQTTTWDDPSEKVRAALKQLGTMGRLFFLPTGTDGAENLGITRFALASGSLRKGAMARCIVEVRNFGKLPQEKVTVTLYQDNLPVYQRVLDRLAGEKAESIPLFTRFERAGNIKLVAKIGPDPLLVDNARYLTAAIREQVRVLLVDGDPSDKPYQGETDFIKTALAPKAVGAARSSIAVRTIPYHTLSGERLTDYHVVILANVPDIGKGTEATLHAYVAQGGGLMVFLGPKVMPVLYNARFQVGGKPILPGELLARVEEKGKSWPLEPAVTGHPITEPLEGLPKELMREARFQQFIRLREPLYPGGRTILKLGGENAPLLAEREIDRGKVLLFTSTASPKWTPFAAHPLFPILLHQAVAYLTRQAHERPFTVGDPMLLPLPATTTLASVLVRDPEGKENPIQVTEQGGQKLLEFTGDLLPGFYDIKYAADAPPIVAAVNVDPAESDVRVLSPEALATALKGLPVHTVPWGEELGVLIQQTRVGRELWRYFMLAALAVLALEAFLANRFTRRISPGGREARPDAREAILSATPAGRETAS